MEQIKQIIESKIDEIIKDSTIGPEIFVETIVNKCLNDISTYIENNYVDITTYKRTFADFDNLRKRLETNNQKIIDRFTDSIYIEIAEFIDDFDMALKISNDKGIIALRNKFINYLSNKNVELYYSINEEFNSDLHEAISLVEGETPNIIVDCIKCGIKRNGNIIRHAKVIVSK